MRLTTTRPQAAERHRPGSARVPTGRLGGRSAALRLLPLAFLLLAGAAARSQDYGSYPQVPGADQGYGSAAGGRAPATSPYKLDTRVDWKKRVLSLRVSLDLVRAGYRLPEGRLEAERKVDRDLPGLAKNTIFSLQVDSYRTVRDTIMDGSLDAEQLVALDGTATRLESILSRDMRSLLTVYEFPLDSVGALYVTYTEPIPAPEALSYSPSRVHTGIVIVATGKLPVHGDRVSEQLRPCLFPRIFDEGMRLLLAKDRVDPDVVRAHGELGYASSIPEDDRTGDDPMLIQAVAIFGTDRTDLIISRADADSILELPENRALLRQGKVTIILDRSELVSSSPGYPRESALPPIP